MKLNLGSSRPTGRYRKPIWVNCDINPQGRPTVLGDGFCLPFKDGTFEEINSVHVLEHLQRDEWPLMLCEMYRVLEPGGLIYVEVPDFPAQCRIYLDKIASTRANAPQVVHFIRTAIWGKTETLGMGHKFGFDQALLKRAMVKTGFDQVTQLTENDDMISSHYRQGPVLLFRGTKAEGVDPKFNIPAMNFDALREYIIQ